MKKTERVHTNYLWPSNSERKKFTSDWYENV